MSLFSNVKSAVGRLAGWGAKASQLVLISATFIIFYDVVMRYAFNRPTTWALEISEYMLVFMTFVGAAQIQKQSAHIRMDYFYNKFSDRMRHYLVIFFNLLAFIFILLIFLTSVKMVLIAHQYGSKSSSLLGTPLFIPYAIVPFGMGLLLLQNIVDLICSFKKTGGRATMEAQRT